jgi:hypothetical protein
MLALPMSSLGTGGMVRMSELAFLALMIVAALEEDTAPGTYREEHYLVNLCTNWSFLWIRESYEFVRNIVCCTFVSLSWPFGRASLR